MTTSILYLDVTSAAVETASKIIAQRKAVRGGAPLRVTVGAKGGQTASVSVNGSTVTMNLPTMPASTMLSRSEADRMLGFVAHECLHVLHTDWHWWQVCVQAGSRVRHWANCLEDVRIEAKELRAGHFPALRGILSATMDHMHYQSLASAAKAGRVIGARLADAPYCLAVLGRMANKYTVPTARNLRRNLHPDVARLVAVALTEVRTCKTTRDVYRLALRLVALENQIVAPAPAAPAPAPKPDQDDAEAGEAGDDAGEAGEAGEADQDDAEAGEAGEADQDDAEAGEAGEADQDDAEAGEAGDDAGEAGDDAGEAGDAAGDGHGKSQAHDLNDAPEATETLEGLAETIKERQPDAPRVHGGGLHGYKAPVASLPRNYTGNALHHVTNFNAALPGRAILHGQISRLLVSPERVQVTHRETSGRLDRRALARLGTGAMDVFSRKQETPGMDTALLVLLDLSGSMSGNRHAMALVTAFHLAASAEDAGAKVAVFGFVDHDDDDGSVAMARLVELLPFGLPVRANAHRLMAVPPQVTTPMSPAILGAAEVLRTMDATRHILMVLTDGDCNYGNGAVTDACLVARTWGVEVVALGMAAPNVVNAFPDGHSVNVNDLAALGKTGLGVLARMLEEAAPDLA